MLRLLLDHSFCTLYTKPRLILCPSAQATKSFLAQASLLASLVCFTDLYHAWMQQRLNLFPLPLKHTCTQRLPLPTKLK